MNLTEDQLRAVLMETGDAIAADGSARLTFSRSWHPDPPPAPGPGAGAVAAGSKAWPRPPR